MWGKFTGDRLHRGQTKGLNNIMIFSMNWNRQVLEIRRLDWLTLLSFHNSFTKLNSILLLSNFTLGTTRYNRMTQGHTRFRGRAATVNAIACPHPHSTLFIYVYHACFVLEWINIELYLWFKKWFPLSTQRFFTTNRFKREPWLNPVLGHTISKRLTLVLITRHTVLVLQAK